MGDAIVYRATNGGRQSIAAPRGCGKSELVKGLIAYVTFANLCRFPLPTAATTPLAFELYEDYRRKLETNELLREDFPEVCVPVYELEGAPQRAGKQHVDGRLTRIKWTAKQLCLPTVAGSPYGGIKMKYAGLDAAFRGMNIDGDRPDFVLIDDPETRESAKSHGQIDDRKQIIDRDIAGLVEEGKEMAIVVLTTIQNSYCLSYRITSLEGAPVGMPAFNGLRYGMISKWPDTVEDPTDESKLGLWSEYIALRHRNYAERDVLAKDAIKYYLDNQAALEAGGELLTDHFVPKFDSETGVQLTYTPMQAQFDKIADTDLASYRTEYQNDPEPEEEEEALKLTAAIVQNKLDDEMQRGDRFEDEQFTTIGIDVGKYASHWTEITWGSEGCRPHISDYGVIETKGLRRDSTDKAIELAVVDALEEAEEWISTRKPKLVLIDSGSGFRDPVYGFTRQAGVPFFPSKGWDPGRFRMPKQSKTEVPFDQAYARWQPDGGVWLYHVETEHWKVWIQKAFLTGSWEDDGSRADGAITLFSNGGDVRAHLSFAHHIVAEEERWVPKEGKLLQRQWYVKSRNNHWLDSTALAAAAGGCLGIRLVRNEYETPIKPKTATTGTTNRFTNHHGQSFVASNR